MYLASNSVTFWRTGNSRQIGIKDLATNHAHLIKRTVRSSFLCMFGDINGLIFPLFLQDIVPDSAGSAGRAVSLSAAAHNIRFAALLAKVGGADRTGGAVTLNGSIPDSIDTQLTFRAAFTPGKSHKLRAAVYTDTDAVYGLPLGLHRAGRAEICTAFIRLKNGSAVFACFLSQCNISFLLRYIVG